MTYGSHTTGGHHSPSNPDGGDPPAPLDDIAELGRGLPRIGTPIHYVSHGNRAGAPCLPGFYLGFDGERAWIATCYGRDFPAEHAMPGTGGGPAFRYATFHLAARCDITGPVRPAQLVAQLEPGAAPFSTDEFVSERNT